MVLLAAGAIVTTAYSADYWSFVAGKYAVEKGDCKLLGEGQAILQGAVQKSGWGSPDAGRHHQSPGNPLQVPVVQQGGRRQARLGGQGRMRGDGPSLAGDHRCSHRRRRFIVVTSGMCSDRR